MEDWMKEEDSFGGAVSGDIPPAEPVAHTVLEDADLAAHTAFEGADSTAQSALGDTEPTAHAAFESAALAGMPKKPEVETLKQPGAFEGWETVSSWTPEEPVKGGTALETSGYGLPEMVPIGGERSPQGERTSLGSYAAKRPAGPEGERRPYTSPYDVYRFNTGGRTPYGQNAGPGPSGDGGGPGTPGDPTGTGQKPQKPSKKGGKGKKTAAVLGLAVVFGLVAGLVFFGATVLLNRIFAKPSSTSAGSDAKVPPTVVIGSQSEGTLPPKGEDGGTSGEKRQDGSEKNLPDLALEEESGEMTVPDVVELVMPSMVSITNTSLSEYYSFFGGTEQYENISAGSGIIVGETETDLLIATNEHVISKANKLTVTFIDNNVIEGTVSASDSRNDLAVIAVKKENISQETLSAIHVIAIGDSDKLRVGETVVAIGNALGYGQSVSKGVVSALNRTVEFDGIEQADLIQTDASINPGNSGGALINLHGELVGINEGKAVNTKIEGVGYAIPMSIAKPILENLGTKASRTKVDEENASYIGVSCMSMPAYYVQSGYPAGAYISYVSQGGPAAQAGVKEGDIITSIDGSSVSSSAQLISYLEYYAAGEKVSFTIRRLNEEGSGFDTLDIVITLGRKKDANLSEYGEAG